MKKLFGRSRFQFDRAIQSMFPAGRGAAVALRCALAAVPAAVGIVQGAHATTQPAFRVESADLVSPSSADTYYGSATTHTNGLGNPVPPEIAALARALGAGRVTDAEYADRVFEYVYSNIDVTPLYGLQKGALGAIIDQSGTAFDQAMLMVELLREGATQGSYGSLSASYKAGAITLTGAEFDKWFGLTNAKAACQMLADGGIPASVNSASSCGSLSGNVTSVTLSHIWVEVATSSGTFAYDPSYKEHTEINGIGLTALRSAMGCATGDCASAVEAEMGGTMTSISTVNGLKNLDKAALETKLTTYSSNLLTNFRNSHAEKSIEEIVGAREVDLNSLPAQATSLPYSSTVQHTWTGDIPDQYRTTLDVTVDDAVANLWVDEIYGLMVSVNQNTTNYWEGELGDYIRFRSVSIVVNDEVVSSGSFDGGGQTIPITLEVDHPYAADSGSYMDETISRTFNHIEDQFLNTSVVNSVLSIVNGWGDVSHRLAARYVRRADLESRRYIDDGDPYDGFANSRQRHVIAARWQAELASAAEMDARIKGYRAQHHHSIGFVYAPHAEEQQKAEFTAETRLSINAEDASSAVRTAASRTLAALGSTLEGGVIRRMSRGTHVASTNALLDYANEDSHEFYFVDNANYNTIKSSLTEYSTSRLTEIEGYLTNGYSVLLPRDGEVDCILGGNNICITGAGFIAVTSDASEIAHIASIQDGPLSKSFKGAGGAGDFAGVLASEIEMRNLMSSGAVGGADISVGSGAFPYSLSFSRSYSQNGGANYHKTKVVGLGTEFGVGWTHNHHSAASFGGDGASVYGGRSIFEATDTIAALVTAGDFSSQTDSLEHLLAKALVMNWWELEAESNVVSVRFANQSARYVKLADDSWYGGMGATYDLAITGSRRLDTGASDPFYTWDNVSITLTGLSGDTLEFENVYASYVENVWTLRLTEWDWSTGPVVDYEYQTSSKGVTQLKTIKNNFDRFLEFAYEGSNGLVKSVTSYKDVPTSPMAHDSTPVTTVHYTYVAHTCDTDHLGLVELQKFKDAEDNETTYHYEDLSDDATCVGVDESTTPDSFDDSTLVFGMDKVWTAEDPVNPVSTTVYDAFGRVESVTDAGSYTTESFVASMGGERFVRSETKNALGNVMTVLRSRLESEVIDAEGKSAVTTLDRLGRRIGESFPNGSSTSYTYMGLDASYAYDSRRNLTQVTVTPASGSGDLPISRSLAWNDDFVVPDWVEDFEGNRTEFTYDAWGRQLTEKLPDDDANGANNPVTTLVYDSGTGLVDSVTNAETIKTDFNYNGFAELTSVKFDTANLNYVTSYTYNIAGDQISVNGPKSGSGDKTEFTYDDNRRLIEVDDPEGGLAKITWNKRGQREKIEQWTGSVWQTVEYTYDVRGLPYEVKDPLDSVAKVLVRDALGRVEQAMDAEGRIVKYTFDSLGRTTKVTEGYLTANAADTQASVFDPVTGQLDSVDDGNDNTTSYAYDGFGRLKTTTWADNSTTSHTYDDNGQTLSTTTRKGDTISFTYNATGQVKTRVADDTLTHVYDIMGRISSITSNATAALSVNYTYDNAGRVNTAGRQDGKTLIYHYDEAGARTKLVHADGYYVEYAYDGIGRMTSITENGASTPLAEYTYDPLGRRTDLERRNGADTSYAFDLANRLTDLDHGFTGEATVTADYTHNDVGQITGKTLSNNDFYWNPSVHGTVTAPANEMNELKRYGPDWVMYDDAGNMTSDGTNTFIYNKTNQMIGAFVGASTIAYSYDPLGRRVKKDVDGTVTEYLLDGGHEIVEYNGSGTILRRFIFGPGVDEVVAMVEGSTTTFYHQNHQGTVIALSDASGNRTQTYTYDEYGASDDTLTGQPFRYTGRRLDPETGLYYYRARYYSPAMGRFMQVDPIGYAAGMNTHAYVGGDPLNMIDPSGMYVEEIIVTGAKIGGSICGAPCAAIGGFAGAVAGFLGMGGLFAATPVLPAGAGVELGTAAEGAGALEGGAAGGGSVSSGGYTFHSIWAPGEVATIGTPTSFSFNLAGFATPAMVAPFANLNVISGGGTDPVAKFRKCLAKQGVERGSMNEPFVHQKIAEKWSDLPREVRNYEPPFGWGRLVDDSGDHIMNQRFPGGYHVTFESGYADRPDGVFVHMDFHDPLKGPWTNVKHGLDEVYRFGVRPLQHFWKDKMIGNGCGG